MNRQKLFTTTLLCDQIDWLKKTIIKELDETESDKIIQSTADQWCEYIESKYHINIPEILEADIYVDEPDEIIIREMRGTRITYHIPFNGDSNVFIFNKPYSRPGEGTQIHIDPPCGIVIGNELQLSYDLLSHDKEKEVENFSRDLGKIKQIIQQMKMEIEEYNLGLKEYVRPTIEYRINKIKDDSKLVESLGYPIKRRNDAPMTYATPEVRRKLKRIGKKLEGKPEPILAEEEYATVLEIISSMVLVMERSPKAFKGMGEEYIRQHFLVQLNGQYRGQATGETFNLSGKTDIIIKIKDKNIFIAECKFWDGPQSLLDSIEQILSYTSWRDTKTAIILFNRDRKFSHVLSQIPEVVKGHNNFIREDQAESETAFRYIFHHVGDKEKELILTVLAFEVPK